MKTWSTKNGYLILRILSGRSNVCLVTNGKVNILVDTSPASQKKLFETNCSLVLPSHGSANTRAVVQKEYKKCSEKLK